MSQHKPKQTRQEIKDLKAEAKAASKVARKNQSVAKQLKNQEKELISQTATQRRHRRAAKNVYDFIGYNLMYQDGICEVEDGLFSQTVAFSDISYQSAREEDQKAIFAAYCQLYDYFGAESSVQLNIINTPIPEIEIGHKVFYKHYEDKTKPLVDEFNQILNNKMKEGVSNLTKQRYLTFSVGAKDVDAAIPKLARMRNDATQTLSKIRCETRVLSGAERLEVINSQLRPKCPLIFSWDDVSAKSGLTTKDIIAPAHLDFKPDGLSSCFKTDDTYGQVLVFRRYGSELTDRCLADIIDLPLPLNLSLHIQAIDKSKAVAYVKQRLAWMDKEIIDEQMAAVKKGYDFQILPSELKYSKEEAEDLLDHLQNKNQRLYIFTGLAYTFANTMDKLGEQVVQIMSCARRNSIDMDTLDLRQREALNSVLPFGHNHVQVSRMFTTAEIAEHCPFATQELFQIGGNYGGQNKLSSNLVFYNRKLLPSPAGYIAGTPGSGKSFTVKREITSSYLTNPDDEFIIFDPAGEYGNLAKTLGGSNEKYGAGFDAHTNPFDLTDVADKNDTAQLAFKIDAFLALSSATMQEGAQGLKEADKSIIARCVELAYTKTARQNRVPILEDFYQILLDQPEREAKGIALRYERYVKGALSFFNHPSNVSFNTRITNIDFKELNSNMLVFGILTKLEAVRNRMYTNFERGVTTWLYIDEVQSLFSHPAIITYFAKFWAEGRKFNLICTGITQNSVYMLEHEAARNMVLNSDYLMLHKQSALDRKAWVNLLGFSTQEESYIDESVKAGEGLLIAGGARIPIKDNFPKGKLYDLFNTKPEEIAQLKRDKRFKEARQKGVSKK